MSRTTYVDGDRHEGGRYEIRLTGHLDTRWATWFDGMNLTHESDGTTVIHGPVADQAALHGLLQKARDVGLPLVSVSRVDPDHTDGPANEPRSAPATSRQGD
jgi:hypothetical protein